MGLDHYIGFVGLLVLLHAGYVTMQYKEQLKIEDEIFLCPKPEAMGELLVGLVLCLVAALRAPGELLPIKLTADNNRVAALPDLVDFMTFNHRGRLLPTNLQMKGSKTKQKLESDVKHIKSS
eukprot:jgi/Mesen1/1865/ME000143S00922